MWEYIDKYLTPDDSIRIYFKDGNSVYGYILECNEEALVMEVSTGVSYPMSIAIVPYAGVGGITLMEKGKRLTLPKL